MNYLHDIKDAKINGGELGSGAALITHTLYRMMFKGPIPEAQDSFLPNQEALVKLIGDKSVDVVVVAAGQPAPIIANMKPEAQKFIKLLKFDPNHPMSKQAMKIYSPATVHTGSYPNLIKEDFTTISVGAFLVTYDYTLQGTVEHLTRFARELCQQFPELQAKGHPKWREVDLSLPPLNDGWTYYGPTAKELRNCRPGQQKVVAKPARACSAEEKILGRACSCGLGNHLLLARAAIAQLLRRGPVVGPAVVERRKAEIHFAPLRVALRLQLGELLAQLAREPRQVLDRALQGVVVGHEERADRDRGEVLLDQVGIAARVDGRGRVDLHRLLAHRMVRIELQQLDEFLRLGLHVGDDRRRLPGGH